MHDADLMGRASTACPQDNASVRTGGDRVLRTAGVLAAKTSREPVYSHKHGVMAWQWDAASDARIGASGPDAAPPRATLRPMRAPSRRRRRAPGSWRARGRSSDRSCGCDPRRYETFRARTPPHGHTGILVDLPELWVNSDESLLRLLRGRKNGRTRFSRGR